MMELCDDIAITEDDRRRPGLHVREVVKYPPETGEQVALVVECRWVCDALRNVCEGTVDGHVVVLPRVGDIAVDLPEGEVGG